MSKLLEMLQAGGVEVRRSREHHHVRDGWIGVDCPKCSLGWRHFRLGFHLASGRCHCWVCGGMNPHSVLSTLLNRSYGEIRQLWDEWQFEVSPIPAIVRGSLRLPEAGPLQEPHRVYLQGRGFDPDVISQQWKVQGIGVAAKLAWRLLIPVMDDASRPVSFTTRSISSTSTHRYVAAGKDEEALPLSSLLYGSHLARSEVIVVEGPIDAWAIGAGGVATCGLGYSEMQAQLIARFPIRAVCFDAEPAALRRAEKLCRFLSGYVGETMLIKLTSGKDAASAHKDEICEIRGKIMGALR